MYNEQYEYVINYLLDNEYPDTAYCILSRLYGETYMYHETESIGTIEEIYIMSGSWLFKTDDLCNLILNHLELELTKTVLDVIENKISRMLGYKYMYDCLPVDPIEYELWRNQK